AARDVVEARAAKMLLLAPVDGTIAIEVAEPGEAVIPGEPVMTMVPEHGIWFGFDVREDRLRGLAMGASVKVGYGESAPSSTAKVVELRDFGEFAVWRAARAVGDHDLNTFFVRLDPIAGAPDLTPGQTVWLTP
ncbi:MAG TPA: HlyD family efflux transporter periplasmic adaptor subunit, partial [Bradyrhizobium sp.]